MPEISVIVPTFKERDNVYPLAAAIDQALAGVDYEIIFVDDDSSDGTAGLVRELAQSDRRVRVVHRVGRTGLGSAVVEGLLASSAPYLAVMDGDLQHDERVLPAMLSKIKAERLDIVVGTRNAEGGSMGEFAQERVHLSQAGRVLSRWVTKVDISDPMSGFFLLTRSFFESVVPNLSTVGFKILIDILASSKERVHIGEVGYTFRTRRHGESKLDLLVGLEFVQLLLDKRFGDYIPVTFLLFGLIGALGVLSNLALVHVLLRWGVEFRSALLVATCTVVAINYVLNNTFTFRSRRLRGIAFWKGMVMFYGACGLGVIGDLFLAENLVRAAVPITIAAATGLLISGIWNYWMSSLLVWGVHRLRQRRAADRRKVQLIEAEASVS